MSELRVSLSMTSLRPMVPILCLANVLVGSASASTRLKIASVPPEYTPTAGPGLPKPVCMQSFYFEVEKETGRARVLVRISPCWDWKEDWGWSRPWLKFPACGTIRTPKPLFIAVQARRSFAQP